ncbi:hypothetical protein O2W14_16400 [Modestobacter sp. VKM Ac-2986]|uniref:hypothetical protein n=1 Tax=Modestobacter sp. VKM Ac-2986 TaxID=3004140 RepID=UPI0022AB6ECC|nr:hypothetical protein [Modestobacter sp. VKM Ac-2986]MCZ2830420.1 hypothetical protein [Modestobacter sp. VKM Ac-2986]
MRLKPLGRPARTQPATPATDRVPLRVRVGRRLRARKLASTAWCAHCEVRPRADLEGDAGRYCSPACAQADELDNWSIA